MRCVIDKQLSLALLADIVSLEEDIDGAVETVAVRDIGAVNPALVAELFDGERQQFLIDVEAEVDSAAPNLSLGTCRSTPIGSNAYRVRHELLTYSIAD